jgi:hypothetical protein
VNISSPGHPGRGHINLRNGLNLFPSNSLQTAAKWPEVIPCNNGLCEHDRMNRPYIAQNMAWDETRGKLGPKWADHCEILNLTYHMFKDNLTFTWLNAFFFSQRASYDQATHS